MGCDVDPDKVSAGQPNDDKGRNNRVVAPENSIHLTRAVSSESENDRRAGLGDSHTVFRN